ncbi:methyltransferase domain-containing protein [Oscillatoria laete-virens NRMC-F 0139]|nr:methyltransferase domain-containing protein [Oscillatoria laete-virens]MDL5052989.1 methyltransferase domain-containing protein [Oscillatoria laete-virens NRMC-F 0139]
MIAEFLHPRFNKKAASYDQHASIQRDVADWTAKWLPLQKNGKALEVGAGTGLFTRHLVNWNGELLISDQSSEMVSIGSQKFSSVQWGTHMADELPFDNLDWIFASSVLQWMPDPLTILKHWHDRLKPGGRVLCSVFVDGTLAELNQFISPVIPLKWKSEHDWLMIFEKAGLNLLSHQTARKILGYSSCHHLLKSLHGIGAVASKARFNAGKLRTIIRDYDRTHHANGQTVATYRFMRVLAQRD